MDWVRLKPATLRVRYSTTRPTATHLVVYTSSMRSCLIHGSEIWLIDMERKAKLDKTEMSMIRWMCGFTLTDRKKNTELKEMLGLELYRMTDSGF